MNTLFSLGLCLSWAVHAKNYSPGIGTDQTTAFNKWTTQFQQMRAVVPKTGRSVRPQQLAQKCADVH